MITNPFEKGNWLPEMIQETQKMDWDSSPEVTQEKAYSAISGTINGFDVCFKWQEGPYPHFLGVVAGFQDQSFHIFDEDFSLSWVHMADSYRNMYRWESAIKMINQLL